MLIVPETATEFSAKRILIAWDGSAHAARAVGDALPFVDGAEVEILSITGEKDLTGLVPGVELAPHLARHGAKVTVRNIMLAGDRSVADVIRREAGEFGADLLVSGAYKHSRLQEWFLGGVTQSLLANCPLPILMSR